MSLQLNRNLNLEKEPFLIDFHELRPALAGRSLKTQILHGL